MKITFNNAEKEEIKATAKMVGCSPQELEEMYVDIMRSNLTQDLEDAADEVGQNKLEEKFESRPNRNSGPMGGPFGG